MDELLMTVSGTKGFDYSNSMYSSARRKYVSNNQHLYSAYIRRVLYPI